MLYTHACTGFISGGQGVLCLPYVIAIAHTGHHSIGELYVKEKKERISLALITILLWVGQLNCCSTMLHPDA